MRTVPSDSKESFGSRGVLTITYRARSRELAISYSDVQRGVITRIVPARGATAAARSLIAQLRAKLALGPGSGLLAVVTRRLESILIQWRLTDTRFGPSLPSRRRLCICR